MHRSRSLLLTLSLSVMGFSLAAQQTQRISVSPNGTGGQGISDSASLRMSGTGQYLVFASAQSDLVPNDNNSFADVFVFDKQTHAVERVSLSSTGVEGNAHSGYAYSYEHPVAITADGRYVAFQSDAYSLVANDLKGYTDIFVHDRVTKKTERVSVGIGGAESNNTSFAPSISSNGRYVAFQSDADNLVANDNNGTRDIFVYDRTNKTTERVSVGNSGTESNGYSEMPTLSGNGRYVAFLSDANNLVANDTNGTRDIFVYDRTNKTTERVNLKDTNTEYSGSYYSQPEISSDGRYVAFNDASDGIVAGDANGTQDVFVRDRTGAKTERISVRVNANNDGGCTLTGLSSNGRYVLFESSASDLVIGDTYGRQDAFLRDRTSKTTTRVSLGSNGQESTYSDSLFSTLSGDGLVAAFVNYDATLTPGDGNPYPDIFCRDIAAQKTQRAIIAPAIGNASNYSEVAVFSADGRFVAFATTAFNLVAGDINITAADVLVYDRQTDQLEAVSVTLDGRTGNAYSRNPALSADGRYVAFVSGASDLVSNDNSGSEDIFVRDRQTGKTERVSVGIGGAESNANSRQPSISADGRYVAFTSPASNLVPNDSLDSEDVFVYDRQNKTTIRASVNMTGGTSDGTSETPSLSGDGRFVAFSSDATNLVNNDTLGVRDVFIRDLQTNTTRRISRGMGGEEANSHSMTPSFSQNGRYVSFTSYATNLTPEATSGYSQVYVADLQAQTLECVSVSNTGEPGNNSSGTFDYYAVGHEAPLSSDGRFITFLSYATNFDAGDTNGYNDVFLYDRKNKTIIRVNVKPDNSPSVGDFYVVPPSLSGDGSFVAFTSVADDLVSGDTNTVEDIFLRGPFVPSNKVNLGGKVILKNISPSAVPQSITFTFRPTSGAAFDRTVLVGPDGWFSVPDLTAQSYVVHVKGSKWLARNRSVDLSQGGRLGVNFLLLPGDANNDNHVNIFDLGTLAEDFNSVSGDINWNGGRSDFNCDASTDIFDLAILAESFNTDGDL